MTHELDYLSVAFPIDDNSAAQRLAEQIANTPPEVGDTFYSFIGSREPFLGSYQTPKLQISLGRDRKYGVYPNMGILTTGQPCPVAGGDSPPVLAATMTALRNVGVCPWADVYSTDQQQVWIDAYQEGRAPFRSFRGAWMTWLSAPLAKQIMPPPEATVVDDGNGGLLLMTAPELHDIHNPKHEAAARAISDALSPLETQVSDNAWYRLKPKEG